MLFAGQLVGGKYRLLRSIGEGGMACVWAARHELLGRDVALKLAPVFGDSLQTERFLREARIIGRFEHPNIVNVVDAGELADEGYLFLAMELLRGAPLSAKMTPSAPLAVREFLPVFIAIASGLETAHAAGVVHRDVKPENVVLAEVTGRVVPKLVDFGISLTTGSNGARITIDGQILGTPAYMSPEQAVGKGEIGPAADVWALGVMLYEALSGWQPFVAPSYHALLRQIIDDAPRALPASAPPELVAIAMRCLEKDPAARYPDAGPLRAALEAALESLDARPTVPSSAMASPTPAELDGRTLPSGAAISASPPPATWAARHLVPRDVPETLRSARTRLAVFGAIAAALMALGAARASLASSAPAAHLAVDPAALAHRAAPPALPRAAVPAPPAEAACAPPPARAALLADVAAAAPKRAADAPHHGTRITSPGF